MPAIVAQGLTRTFRTRGRTVTAVRNLDLRIDTGEIVGFLGPNGAGKTTTLRMLTTLLRPTAGSARIAGADLRTDPDAVRRRIGYVAQTGGTEPRCRVGEELMYQARLYRLARARARQRVAAVLDRLDLGDLEQRLVSTLSGGQRRRLDIALGLVHAPALVFLDEPTVGLDPHSRASVWEHVRQLRDELGTTVFLTTHYLEEADALCDRILVIDDGRIIAEDTAEHLKRQVSCDVVTVELGGPEGRSPDGLDSTAGLDRAKAALVGLRHVREVSLPGGRTLRLVVDHGDRAVIDIVTTLHDAGLTVDALQLTRASLEEVFLALTSRQPTY
jgi:ABC-2 type transport system ATP-binding protein